MKKQNSPLDNKLFFAAIDIGSNAVRLLIKSAEEGVPPAMLRKVQLVRVPLRLGEDAFTKGEISDLKARRLIRLIRSYKLLMKVYGVMEYRACATSAMRDAANGKALAEKIFEKTGINIEVIDGLEEARIVYDSHIADLLDHRNDYIYVDVGGGSTEISLISNGSLRKSVSYNVGTVRMLKGKVKPSEMEAMNQSLDALSAEYPRLNIIGSGGNINKLYRLSASGKGQKENYLFVATLEELYDMLHSETLEQRMSHFIMNSDRADVIVPAAEIFLNIACRVKADRIFVPTIGISDGITHALYSHYLKNRT